VKNRILIYIVITYSLASMFPWWIIAFVGTLIGFLSKTSKEAVLYGATSLIFVWFVKLIINFFISDYLIIDKIKLFFNLNSFLIICISLIIPLLIGVLSALFGYQLKKVSKS